MQAHDAGDGDKLVTVSLTEMAGLLSMDPAELKIELANWNEAADKVYIVLSGPGRLRPLSGGYAGQ